MTPFVSTVVHKSPLAGLEDPTDEEIAARLKPISDAMYGYTSGKVEPVVYVIEPEKDWIVRNSYDALIWVSTHTPILDIDLEDDDEDSGIVGNFNFANNRARRELAFQIVNYLQQLQWDFRLYYTRSGFRVILPNYNAEGKTFADNSVFWTAISGLPIDRNYKDLCIKQKCFRARLSTKPWRSDASISWFNSISDTGLDSYCFSCSEEVGIARLLRSSFNALSDDEGIRVHDILTGAENEKVEELQ